MWVAIGSGLATSASVSFMLYFQKPEEHNPMHSEFWISAAMIAFMAGGKDFFLYLKQNPAPAIKTKTEMVGTKTVTAPTGETTTTVVQKTTTVEAPAEQRDSSKPDVAS